MFAWIDLAWLVGGAALGVVFNAKILSFITSVKNDVAILKADVAALEAKIAKFNATVKTDVTSAATTAQADVAAVKAKL